MPAAVMITCPNCRTPLRMPPGLDNICVRCKFCSNYLKISRRPANGFYGSPPASIVPPSAQYQPVNGYGQQPHNLDSLPSYTPPAPQYPAAGHGHFGAQPIVETLPDAGPSDYTPAFDRASSRHSGRGSYRGPTGGSGNVKWLAVGAIVFLGAGILIAVLAAPEMFTGDDGTTKSVAVKGKEQVKSGGNHYVAPPEEKKGPRPPVAAPIGPVPRRMLAIGVGNYFYANPLSLGASLASTDNQRKDFYKALDRLADAWRVPKDQRYFISDGPVAEGKIDERHPPLKMVIEGSMDGFLSTCRERDRIIIVFSGHAIEKDGEAYLVPLEGEFEDLPSLIPLKTFYEKLAECPAQEKLVIFDVCRFNSGRGIERPIFGMMTPELEKALHDCPDGTTVWTTCSAGQHAYEMDSWGVNMPGLKLYESAGSIFFGLFFAADYRIHVFDKRQEGAGLHRPEDPLPIGPVSEYLNEKTSEVVDYILTADKRKQTPKITNKARKEWVAYDANDKLAAKFEMAAPPPTAKREEVAAMFQELVLPDIKAAVRRESSTGNKIGDNFPFTEEQLKNYFDSGPTFAEIAKGPAKYAKEHPLRAAAVEAIEEIRKLKQETDLPFEFSAPINDMTKTRITNVIQRAVTERQGILEEIKEKLEIVAKKKEMEKSKRWLATYDYALAQTKIRLAYIYEYNLALGNVKGEKLPEIDMEKHRGWRLSSVEKMTSPKEIRDWVEEGKTVFAEMVKEHPNTPWAVMAKTQRNMTFGLKWEPVLKGQPAEGAAN